MSLPSWLRLLMTEPAATCEVVEIKSQLGEVCNRLDMMNFGGDACTFIRQLQFTGVMISLERELS